jgi:hypothetical protein
MIHRESVNHTRDQRARIPMSGMQRITAGLFPPMA